MCCAKHILLYLLVLNAMANWFLFKKKKWRRRVWCSPSQTLQWLPLHSVWEVKSLLQPKKLCIYQPHRFLPFAFFSLWPYLPLCSPSLSPACLASRTFCCSSNVSLCTSCLLSRKLFSQICSKAIPVTISLRVSHTNLFIIPFPHSHTPLPSFVLSIQSASYSQYFSYWSLKAVSWPPDWASWRQRCSVSFITVCPMPRTMPDTKLALDKYF